MTGFSLQLEDIRFAYPGSTGGRRGDCPSNRPGDRLSGETGGSTRRKQAGETCGSPSCSPSGRLEPFSLAFERFSPGACTALLGPNGSGKTTVGKLAAGILKPDSGRVLFGGQDIAGWELGRIGKQVGYLFQDPSRQIFAPHPLEEIAFPLELRGVPKQDAGEKARRLLAEFELEDIAGSTTYTLSRGEKQRLAIAAVMACEPQYFILDEPTTGLDKRRRDMLAVALRRLADRGVGILLITHDRSFADALGAEIRYIEGGRLLDA